MVTLTEDQVHQLIDTLENPGEMKVSIALMFLKSLLEGEE